MKRIALLSALMLIPSLLFLLSCDNDPCNCNGTPFSFSVDDINLNTTEIKAPTNRRVEQGDTVRSALKFDLFFETSNIAPTSPNINWSDWGSSLYACSCASPGRTTDTITKIEVTTVYDLDSNHLAGSPINDLLEFDYFGNQTDSTYLVIMDNPTLNFRFTTPNRPRYTIAPQFALKVKADVVDGRVLEAQTVDMVLR
jgi:hypothetical protein